MPNAGCVEAKIWKGDALLAGKEMQALADNAMPFNSRLISKEMPKRAVAKARAMPDKAESNMESRSQ